MIMLCLGAFDQLGLTHPMFGFSFHSHFTFLSSHIPGFVFKTFTSFLFTSPTSWWRRCLASFEYAASSLYLYLCLYLYLYLPSFEYAAASPAEKPALQVHCPACTSSKEYPPPIPDICHRRHRRCLCNKIMSGVKFSRLNAKICIFYSFCRYLLLFFGVFHGFWV